MISIFYTQRKVANYHGKLYKYIPVGICQLNDMQKTISHIYNYNKKKYTNKYNEFLYF